MKTATKDKQMQIRLTQEQYSAFKETYEIYVKQLKLVNKLANLPSFAAFIRESLVKSMTFYRG